MPAWLGAERAWALKIPMLGMTLGRTLTNLAIPALVATMGWRRSAGVAFAGATAAAAAAWALGAAETVDACPRVSDAERRLLAGPQVAKPPTTQPAADKGGGAAPVEGVGRMLRRPAVRAVILAHTTTSTLNICLAQWAPTVLMESHNCSPAVAGGYLAVANAVDILGNFVSGAVETALLRLGYGPAAVQTLCHSSASALHAVCLVGFTLAPSPQAATALYCLMTATMSMVQSAFFGTYLDVGGKQVGLLMSIGNSVANVPGVLVPIVGAFVRQRFGSFTPLFAAVAAAHAAAAVVFRRTIA